VQHLSLESPVGPLTVWGDGRAVRRVDWLRRADSADAGEVLKGARLQLSEYFAGERRAFDLPLRVEGSDFQRAVCDRMTAIPFGETVTYGEIAAELGQSAQAVGNACGGNPIPVIIPCHRVLGATGLGGFSGKGGVETKVALLRLEGAASLLL